MSVVKVPGYRNYFTGPMSSDIIRNSIGVRKFEIILQHLHFTDNQLQVTNREDSNFDFLFKIRPLLQNLNQSFSDNAHTESHVSIDEMLIPTKGMVPNRVYMPNKPHKRGFKAWSMAGSKSGYVHHIQMSGDKKISHEKVHHSIGNSGLVVLELTEKLPEKSHVYFDNYFASPLLAVKLKEKGHDSTFTLRGNRKAGADKCMMTEKELKAKGRGAVDYVQSNGVLVCHWYDKKLVSVASTEYSVKPMETVKRWSVKEKSKQDVLRPYLIKQYNSGMGGVDLADQKVATYRLSLKTNRWYKKLLYWFIDLSMSNAWACYKVDFPETELKFVDFKVRTAQLMMDTSRSNCSCLIVD